MHPSCGLVCTHLAKRLIWRVAHPAKLLEHTSTELPFLPNDCPARRLYFTPALQRATALWPCATAGGAPATYSETWLICKWSTSSPWGIKDQLRTTGSPRRLCQSYSCSWIEAVHACPCPAIACACTTVPSSVKPWSKDRGPSFLAPAFVGTCQHSFILAHGCSSRQFPY